MQPIFEPLIQMWNKMGIDLPVKEGMYWIDNQIIKAFDKSGELCFLYRIKISDDLKIDICHHKDWDKHKDKIFEKWEDTYRRFEKRLKTLENNSLNLISQILKDYPNHIPYVLTSTGKDSVLAQWLCHKINKNIQTVFNNTSIDCADTYKVVNIHPEWIKTNPPIGFYQWIKKMNYIPNRFSRGCCDIFKEGNHIEYFKNVTKALWFMGVRNDESAKRSKYEDIGKNPKWKEKDWIKILPIRKWTDLDVWLYTIENKLFINTKYKKGYPRVGCAIVCPYYTKTIWVLDKYWYPKAYNRWHRILNQDFLNNQRWGQLNCTLAEYHKCWNGGLLRSEPNNEVIEELMSYKDIKDKNIAKQYFNKQCFKCNRNVRQKDVIAMNMKFNGRNVEKFMCKRCLKNYLHIDSKQWDEYIKAFKEQGCALF